MKKAVKILIVLMFLLGTIYLVSLYMNFHYFKTNSYTFFRKDLSRFINSFYVGNEYKIPNSIDEILDGSTSINTSEYPYYNEMIRTLQIEVPYLRLKYITDSNTLIIYRIGFDGIDRELNGVVHDLDSLSFCNYLFGKKGDVVISWVQFLEKSP